MTMNFVPFVCFVVNFFLSQANFISLSPR